jgi:hypothetical protein
MEEPSSVLCTEPCRCQGVLRVIVLNMFRLHMEDHGHGHTMQTTEKLLRIKIAYLISLRTKILFLMLSKSSYDDAFSNFSVHPYGVLLYTIPLPVFASFSLSVCTSCHLPIQWEFIWHLNPSDVSYFHLYTGWFTRRAPQIINYKSCINLPM